MAYKSISNEFTVLNLDMLNKMPEKNLFVIMYFEHTHISFVLDTDLTITGIGG